MIKLEKTEVVGFEPAIRGMRNPMNSWDKSDSMFVENLECHDVCGDLCTYCRTLDTGDFFVIGENDYALAKRLSNGGPVHAKYRRMINVYVDITAPLYWWKEFDTYKIGTVANSCSTMHKIHDKEFTIEDFSCEHLIDADGYMNNDGNFVMTDGPEIEDHAPYGLINCCIIPMLNKCRELYISTKDKIYWWQMIQLLPSSYNQKRTVMLNYEVLHNIYAWRREHKLDEWHDFCKWIEELPYRDLIIVNKRIPADI